MDFEFEALIGSKIPYLCRLVLFKTIFQQNIFNSMVLYEEEGKINRLSYASQIQLNFEDFISGSSTD